MKSSGISHTYPVCDRRVPRGFSSFCFKIAIKNVTFEIPTLLTHASGCNFVTGSYPFPRTSNAPRIIRGRPAKDKFGPFVNGKSGTGRSPNGDFILFPWN